jgi:hypothetical protein
MRLRGRKGLRVNVAMQPGNPPLIVFGFGAFTIEADVDEALAFGHALADAVEQARGGSSAC